MNALTPYILGQMDYLSIFISVQLLSVSSICRIFQHTDDKVLPACRALLGHTPLQLSSPDPNCPICLTNMSRPMQIQRRRCTHTSVSPVVFTGTSEHLNPSAHYYSTQALSANSARFVVPRPGKTSRSDLDQTFMTWCRVPAALHSSRGFNSWTEAARGCSGRRPVTRSRARRRA